MRSLIVAAFAVALHVAAQTETAGFFRSIRDNDLAGIRSALKDKAAANAPGARDVTGLMQAAAFGSEAALNLLLEAGADVNAASSAGHTALIYAVNQPAKVRLLLAKGAAVDAKTRLGNTALMAASAQQGNVEVVKMLLAKGADPKAANQAGFTPLLMAANADDGAIVRLLIEHGADVRVSSPFVGGPLGAAAGNGNIEMVRLFLGKGAPVDTANTMGGKVKHGEIALKFLTPLMVAAAHADARVIGALLDAGANVNAKDVRGMTPLMLAVSSERQNIDVVKLLLSKGAEVNVNSGAGETALDWALKFGDPAVIAELRKAGGVTTATPAAAPSRAPAKDAREAVVRSLPLLQRTSGEFFRQSGCAACHHTYVTSVVTASARARQLPVDEATAAEQRKIVKFGMTQFAQGYMERSDGPALDIQLNSFLSMALDNYAPDEVTDAIVFNVVAQQSTDGAWRMGQGISRSPIEEGHFGRTALGILGLRTYAFPGRRGELDDRLARARRWLESNPPQTTDDMAMRILGLKWSGVSNARLSDAVKSLVKAQREDGGWSGNRHLSSDPYATGVSLYALHQAGAATAHGTAMKRAVNYLLATQVEDGSWFMRSRAPKFQPYFESGFPYGHDQWISASATAWATIALASIAEPPATTRAGR